MRKTAREIYQALSEEFVRKGIASNRFSELEELYTWASIGENAKSEYEEINELLERLRECEEKLKALNFHCSEYGLKEESFAILMACEKACEYFKKYEDKNVR